MCGTQPDFPSAFSHLRLRIDLEHVYWWCRQDLRLRHRRVRHRRRPQRRPHLRGAVRARRRRRRVRGRPLFGGYLAKCWETSTFSQYHQNISLTSMFYQLPTASAPRHRLTDAKGFGVIWHLHTISNFSMLYPTIVDVALILLLVYYNLPSTQLLYFGPVSRFSQVL